MMLKILDYDNNLSIVTEVDILRFNSENHSIYCSFTNKEKYNRQIVYFDSFCKNIVYDKIPEQLAIEISLDNIFNFKCHE